MTEDKIEEDNKVDEVSFMDTSVVPTPQTQNGKEPPQTQNGKEPIAESSENKFCGSQFNCNLDISEDDRNLLNEFQIALNRMLPANRGVKHFEVVQIETEEEDEGVATAKKPTDEAALCGFPTVTSDETEGIAKTKFGSPYLLDMRRVEMRKSYLHFAGSEIELNDEGQSSSDPSMIRIERVHGDKQRIVDSIADRINRLKQQVPEAVSAVSAFAEAELQREMQHVDEPNPDCYFNNEAERQHLAEAKEIFAKYILHNPEEQKNLYGPEEVNGGLFDMWAPSGYTTVQSIRSKLHEAVKTQEQPAKPLFNFESVLTCQGLSWTAYSSKWNNLSERIHHLEKELELSKRQQIQDPSGSSSSQATKSLSACPPTEGEKKTEEDPTALVEGNTMGQCGAEKKQTTTISDDISKLLRQLDVLCDDGEFRRLERRLGVIAAELELLDGCGVPIDDINPDASDEWRPEKQLKIIYDAVIDSNPIMEKLGEAAQSLKEARNTYYPILTLLKGLHEEECHVRELNGMTKACCDSVTKLTENSLQQKVAAQKCMESIIEKTGGKSGSSMLFGSEVEKVKTEV